MSDEWRECKGRGAAACGSHTEAARRRTGGGDPGDQKTQRHEADECNENAVAYDANDAGELRAGGEGRGS